MDNRYTEGICHDGAAILDNGQMITITKILNRLNKGDELEKENQELRGENNYLWRFLGNILLSMQEQSGDPDEECPFCMSELFNMEEIKQIEEKLKELGE